MMLGGPSAYTFMVLKSGETTTGRLLIDYSEVNKVIMDESNPTHLRVEDICRDIPEGSAAARNSLQQLLRQIPLSEESKLITEFRTHQGNFQHTVMPNGLKVASGAAKCKTDKFSSLAGASGMLCYLDDVIIFDSDMEKLQKSCPEYLAKISQANIELTGETEFSDPVDANWYLSST